MSWYEWLLIGVIVGATVGIGFCLWQLSKIELWR